MNINDLVYYSVKQNASDLHLCSGHQPRLRIKGELHILDLAVLSVEAINLWLTTNLSDDQQTLWQQHQQIDFALQLDSGTRLRVNASHYVGGHSLSIRVIPEKIPRSETLGLPTSLYPAVFSGEGLILICGKTGSGKSTTLASLIQLINHHYPWHVITLEDPIEYRHTSQQALIQQREIGLHTSNFAQGLRTALRQDPNVLLVGELRDLESVSLALTAAETGHLVLATLHTRNATQAVERVIDLFPVSDKGFVRAQLAASLGAVLAQKLLPASGGGQVAAYELLLNTPAVANLIREEKTYQLPSLLQTGLRHGMQSFEQAIHQLQQAGKIRDKAVINPKINAAAVQTSFPK